MSLLQTLLNPQKREAIKQAPRLAASAFDIISQKFGDTPSQVNPISPADAMVQRIEPELDLKFMDETRKFQQDQQERLVEQRKMRQITNGENSSNKGLFKPGEMKKLINKTLDRPVEIGEISKVPAQKAAKSIIDFTKKAATATSEFALQELSRQKELQSKFGNIAGRNLYIIESAKNDFIGVAKTLAENTSRLVSGASALKVRIDPFINKKDKEVWINNIAESQAALSEKIAIKDKEKFGGALGQFAFWGGLSGASEKLIAKYALKRTPQTLAERAFIAGISDGTTIAATAGLQELSQEDPSLKRWLGDTLIDITFGQGFEAISTLAKSAPEAVKSVMTDKEIVQYVENLQRVVQRFESQGVSKQEILDNISNIKNTPWFQDFKKDMLSTRGFVKVPGVEVPKIKKLTPERAEIASQRETAIEFAISKQQKQARFVDEISRPVFSKLEKINPSPETDLYIFNAIENPKEFPARNALEQEIIDDARKIDQILVKEKQSRELLDAAWEGGYMRTILENDDGTPASQSRLDLLRSKGGEAFHRRIIASSASLDGGGSISSKNIANKERKFENADARDEILKEFGLRTKRSFVQSFSANVELTKRITSNKDFNDAVRSLAQKIPKDVKVSDFASKLKVKGKGMNDVIEAYNLNDISAFKQKIRGNMVEQRNGIIKDLRKAKKITDSQAKILKAKIREEGKAEIKDLREEGVKSKQEIKRFWDDLRSDLKVVGYASRKKKKELTNEAKEKISKFQDAAQAKINSFLLEASQRKAILEEAGLFDAGTVTNSGRNPFPTKELSGIMVSKRDFKALRNIVNRLGKDTLLGNIEDFSKSLKAIQATFDLFQIPRAIRSSIENRGIINGSWTFVDTLFQAIQGKAFKDFDPRRIADAAEFTQLGKHADFDIDVWNNVTKEINADKSFVLRAIEKSSGLPYLKGATSGVKKVFGALEKFQWESIMIPLKTRAFEEKVKDLTKSFAKQLNEGKVTLRDIKIEAGRAVDDIFSGQNWDKKMARNPNAFSREVQRGLRITFFAPDLLLSSVNQLKRSVIDAWAPGLKGNVARKAVARKVLYGLLTTQLISYKLNGHSTFENDDPRQWTKIEMKRIRDEQGNPFYLDLIGDWGKVANILTEPVKSISGKVSGISKLFSEFVVNKHLDFSNFNPLPFNLSSLLGFAVEKLTETGERKFGIPEKVSDQALINSMEFLGVSGTFATGKRETATLFDVIKDIKNEKGKDKFKNIAPFFLGENVADREEIKEAKQEQKIETGEKKFQFEKLVRETQERIDSGENLSRSDLIRIMNKNLPKSDPKNESRRRNFKEQFGIIPGKTISDDITEKASKVIEFIEESGISNEDKAERLVKSVEEGVITRQEAQKIAKSQSQELLRKFNLSL